jgi:hypothetical protein
VVQYRAIFLGFPLSQLTGTASRSPYGRRFAMASPT